MGRITTTLIALALLLTACASNQDVSTTTTRGPSSGGDGRVNAQLASYSLVPFDACDAFLDYVIERGTELVGPYGLNPGYGYGLPGDAILLERGEFTSDDAGAPVTTTAAAEETLAPQAGGDGDFSGTNVQELGVDEPDIVKTDGKRIIALSNGVLYVIDVTNNKPRITGTLTLNNYAVQDMFLSGDRVLLLGGAWNAYPGPIAEGDVEFAPEYQTPVVRLVEVDLTGGDPDLMRTMDLDGRYVSARMVDGTIRIVVNSSPTGFEWKYPKSSGIKSEREALKANQELIEESDISNWVPYYVVSDDDGDVIDEGSLVACERAHHPADFSGLDMLSVLTIDLDEGLFPVDATGVLATGSTVYASTESLYVATARWVPWWTFEAEEDFIEAAENAGSQIHKFDISSTESSDYVASGQVQGYLLNQFAMSEHEGLLRVATTTEPNWGRGAFPDQESLVTVLETSGNELVEVGKVGGLGEGERIYSVRFIGDVGYVVTFRQTDPLYTLDLSDPTNPEVKGELKILGYSAYLHPMDDGLLIGIGQDANEQGQVKGTQISVFDVSDLSKPVRLHQLALGEGSNSEVEYDHHAFLHWAETGLTMLPVQSWNWSDEGGESGFAGVLGFEVSEDGIEEIATVIHPGGATEEGWWDWEAGVRRSIVIGDSVYTVSHKGLMKSDLDTLDEQAWLKF